MSRTSVPREDRHSFAPALRTDLARLPMSYCVSAASAADRHPLLAAAVAAAANRWPGRELTLECQTVDLREGAAPGIPAEQPAPTTSTSEVAIACLGDAPLLEVAGELVDACSLAFVRSGTPLRFHRTEHRQEVAVILLRPRDGRELARWERTGARVFAPAPTTPDGELPAWAKQRDLRFRSRYEVLAPMPRFSMAALAAEPQFRAAAPAFLLEHGGPIARAFVQRLPSAWLEPGADVIVQIHRDELSPGFAPALIHWHLDGTSRANRRSDGTPDLREPGRVSEQIIACVGPAAPTALLLGEVALPEIPVSTPAHEAAGVWQRLLLHEIAAGRLWPTTVPTDTVVAFGWGGFHTASKAGVEGWRLFAKAMRGRGDTPTNERRHRGTVAWPSNARHWPDDPCGVFPERLP